MDELHGDAAILNYIFTAGSSISFSPRPSLPAAVCAAPAAWPGLAAELAEHRELSSLESSAVTAAESGQLEEALAQLDAVCARAPSRARAFNNRAQARRLAGDSAGARADLDAAIGVGSAWLQQRCGGAGGVGGAAPGVEEHPLAAFHRRVLSQAFTQRAGLHHAAGAAEEEAEDLRAAAQLGSAVARAVTSGCNPYATMCHAAVQVMIAGAGGEAQEGGGAAR